MKKSTKEWVKKAEQDYVIASQSRQSIVPLHDGVCFHCQQCAEKFLKGLLEELGLPIPKIHNLVVLLATLTPHHPILSAYRRGLVFLTSFAVDTRYPGKNANKRKADASFRWAERVRATCRTLLGIRERRRKK